MEKDVGKIKKNETTDIIVRIDDYKGKKGLTIREYITSEKYTGFSKSGTRIPADEFLNFRDIINTINLDEMTGSSSEEKKGEKEVSKKADKKEKKSKKKVEKKEEPKAEEEEAKEESEEESTEEAEPEAEEEIEEDEK